MIFQDEISVDTRGHGDMHDIAGPVQGVVGSSGIEAGTAHVFNIGSTGAIGTIE